MKKLSKFLITTFLVTAALVAIPQEKAEAGTYTVGSFTFTATHCNAYGVCHDPSQKEASDVLYTMLAKQKTSYKLTLSCGNTVTLALKSCKVTNVCSNGNSVNLSSKCKRTTTTCACGCASGVCNTCPGDNDDNDKDKDDDLEPIDDPSCTEDLWIESGWSACVDGMQSQLYTKVRDCKNVNTPSPSATRSCNVGDIPPVDGEPLCKYPAADGSCPPPVITFSASPKLISKGGSCVLRWEVSGAESCEIEGETVDEKKGTKAVSPETTSVYRISCTNGPASASKVELCSVQDISEE